MSVFVAVRSREQVVGTIASSVVRLEEGHLRGMAVSPAMRGGGIASQLLSGVRAAPAQMYAGHAGYHRAAPAGDALLRKARLPAFRKNQGLLRDAVDRTSKNFALKSLHSSSRSGRKEFLLPGGLQQLTVLDATGGQHFDFGFLLTRHVCTRLGCNDKRLRAIG